MGLCTILKRHAKFPSAAAPVYPNLGLSWTISWARQTKAFNPHMIFIQGFCQSCWLHSRPCAAHANVLAAGHSKTSDGLQGCAGEVKIFATRKLTPLRRVKRAHTIFVTAITFSQDGEAVVSTSADATARVTLVVSPSGSGSGGSSKLSISIMLAAFVLLLAVLVQLLRQWQSGTLPLTNALGFQTFMT